LEDDIIFLFDGDCGMEEKDDDVGLCCCEEEVVVTLFKLEDARSIYRACVFWYYINI